MTVFYKCSFPSVKKNVRETQLLTLPLTRYPLQFSTLTLCMGTRPKTNSAWLAASLQFLKPDDLPAATPQGDGTPPRRGGWQQPGRHYCRVLQTRLRAAVAGESHRAETPPANCAGNLEPSAPGFCNGGGGATHRRSSWTGMRIEDVGVQQWSQLPYTQFNFNLACVIMPLLSDYKGFKNREINRDILVSGVNIEINCHFTNVVPYFRCY